MGKEYQTKDGRKVNISLQTVEEVEESLAVISEVAKEGVYLMEDGVDQRRVEWTKKQMENNDDTVLFIVARMDGKIVGNLDMVRYGGSPKTAHVRYLDMAILDGYRSIGVGSALMVYGVKWADGKGVEKILLEVFSTNTRAINLYKKFGFEIEGTNRGAVKLLGKRADIVQMGLNFFD